MRKLKHARKSKLSKLRRKVSDLEDQIERLESDLEDAENRKEELEDVEEERDAAVKASVPNFLNDVYHRIVAGEDLIPALDTEARKRGAVLRIPPTYGRIAC